MSSTVSIHPSALVSPGAELAEGVVIGPYCTVGPKVKIGAGTHLLSHVVVDGRTSLGAHNKVFPFCVLGAVPQDKKYAGEDTALVIGDHNTIRESCTFNLGVTGAGGVTTVGSHNWIMAYVHIAHDCTVGNHTTFANHATLAGHVEVQDWVTLGGFVGVHQFCKVGAHSFCGVGTVLVQDLPPFVMVAGNPAKTHGINSEGLKRRGFSPEEIAAVKRAYRIFYRSGLSLEEALTALAPLAAEFACVQPFVNFMNAASRGVVR